MLIIAENGSVKIGGQYMDKVEYCHIRDYQMPVLQPTNPGNDYGAYKGSAQNHHLVIRNVVNVLSNTPSAAITTNILEGLKVVDIIERIYNCKEWLSIFLTISYSKNQKIFVFLHRVSLLADGSDVCFYVNKFHGCGRKN